MNSSKKLILNESQIKQIVRRIAYQIYESNTGVKKLALVGICNLGYELSALLINELRIIAPGIAVDQFRLELDKSEPRNTVQLDEDVKILSGKSIILVDDVLNTGKTLAHSLLALLAANVSKIETAVLVDRGHPQFPISATFSGYQLSTTLEEHIEVQLGTKPGVYLY